MACSAHVAKELATIRLKQAELLERVNQARPAAAHYSFELRALSRTHASNRLCPPQQEVALTETKHTALHSTELVGASEFIIARTVYNIASVATDSVHCPARRKTKNEPAASELRADAHTAAAPVPRSRPCLRRLAVPLIGCPQLRSVASNPCRAPDGRTEAVW